jgi:hypothetical protein
VTEFFSWRDDGDAANGRWRAVARFKNFIREVIGLIEAGLSMAETLLFNHCWHGERVGMGGEME